MPNGSAHTGIPPGGEKWIPPARIALSSSFLMIRLLPSLGIVLAGISVYLVGAGLRDDASPAITAHQARPPIDARDSMTMPIVRGVCPPEDGPRLLVEQWRGPRNGNSDLRGSSDQRSGCLLKDCMSTRRTAAPRVPIERPAGNLRVALAAMAIAQRRGPWTAACPCLAMEAMRPRPVPATSEDRIAKPLLGPGQPCRMGYSGSHHRSMLAALELNRILIPSSATSVNAVDHIS